VAKNIPEKTRNCVALMNHPLTQRAEISEKGQEIKYLTPDDNNGTDNNAKPQKLSEGKTYIIKITLYYKRQSPKPL
jgi:hypothetical protein